MINVAEKVHVCPDHSDKFLNLPPPLRNPTVDVASFLLNNGCGICIIIL